MARSDLRAKIRLEGDASGANKAIKSTESSFKKLGSSLKRGALAMVAALAAVAGAFKLLESAGARLGQQRALERTLTAQGIAVDEFVGKLKSLANNQIATSDLILASNRALALGIAASDLPGLLEAATKASVSLGISATQAFNDITTGVGRASPLILDNLGIVVDAVKIYAAFAAEIGISAEALTKQQKTAALSAAVMENAAKGAADFAVAQSKVTVALSKSKTQLKEWFETVVDGVASSDSLSTAIDNVSTGMSDYAAATRGAIQALKDLIPAQAKSEEGFVKSDTIIRAFAVNYSVLSTSIRAYGKEVKAAEDAQEKQRLGLIEAEAAFDRARGGIEGLTAAQIELAKVEEESIARTNRIEAGLKDEASALSKLAAALGEVTQIELERELLDIAEALDEARESTDANSDAFVRYEQIATEKMERIQTNIQRLRDGLEVLVDTTEGAGDAIAGFGDDSDTAGNQVDDLGDSIDGASESTETLRVGMQSATQGLQQAGAQAIITAREFDALADSAGRAAAVSAALAGGGTLSQGGTRVRLAGGGSRLTNVSGRGNRSSYALSQFGTGGRSTLDDDGNMRPA